MLGYSRWLVASLLLAVSCSTAGACSSDATKGTASDDLGMDVWSDAGPESDAGAAADAAPDTVADTVAAADTAADTVADADTAADAGPVADAVADANADMVADADTAADAGPVADAVADANADTVADADTATDAATDAAMDTATDAVADMATDADTATDVDTVADTVAAADTVIDAVSDVDAVADTVADTVAAADAVIDAVSDVDAVAVMDAVSDVDAVADTVAAVDAVVDTAADTAADTAPDSSPDGSPDGSPDALCPDQPSGFTYSYGAGGWEAAAAVTALPDGGLALAGHTDSKGAGYKDFWLVRVDPCGALVWDRTYGGAQYDEANAVAALADGGFAVAGYTQSKGAGGRDFWLVRTDEDGALVWDETYGGANYDVARAVAALPDGGFAVAGYTSSKGAGDEDFWLVRTDAGGALAWDETFGGAGRDEARAMTALPDGGFALAGLTYSQGAGARDAWLVRTDAEGAVQWEQTYGGTANDEAFSVAAVPDGGFALGGLTFSKGQGGGDFWLVRTDASGAVLWEQTYGGGDRDEGHAVAVLPDGGLALGGFTRSLGAGLRDFWLVRTAADGAVLWTEPCGGAAWDEAYGLAVLPDGGLALVGYSESFGAGWRDFWLVRTDAAGHVSGW